jgi:hypothetical protein
MASEQRRATSVQSSKGPTKPGSRVISIKITALVSGA